MKKGTYLITGQRAVELCQMFELNPMLDYRAVAKLFDTNDCTIRNTLMRCGVALPEKYGKYSFPTTKFEKAKWSANRKDIPFEITKEDMQVTWEQQTGLCVYSGRKLQFPSKTRVFDGTASLDRIDSTIGYIAGNIQWTHKDINLLKYNFTTEYFLSLCNSIVKYSYHSTITEIAKRPLTVSKNFKKLHGNIELQMCHDFNIAKLTYTQLAERYKVTTNTVKSTLMRNRLIVGTPKTNFSYTQGTFNKLIKSAIKRQVQLRVTMEYLRKLFDKQLGRCTYTGWQLTFGSSSGCSDGTASLDRIDSNKGYVEGNVQWIHKDVNLMKLCHSHANFIGICNEVVHHMKLA